MRERKRERERERERHEKKKKKVLECTAIKNHPLLPTETALFGLKTFKSLTQHALTHKSQEIIGR